MPTPLTGEIHWTTGALILFLISILVAVDYLPFGKAMTPDNAQLASPTTTAQQPI